MLWIASCFEELKNFISSFSRVFSWRFPSRVFDRSLLCTQLYNVLHFISFHRVRQLYYIAFHFNSSSEPVCIQKKYVHADKQQTKQEKEKKKWSVEESSESLRGKCERLRWFFFITSHSSHSRPEIAARMHSTQSTVSKSLLGRTFGNSHLRRRKTLFTFKLMIETSTAFIFASTIWHRNDIILNGKIIDHWSIIIIENHKNNENQAYSSSVVHYDLPKYW